MKINIIYKKEALKFLYKHDRILKQRLEEKLYDFFILNNKNIDIKKLEPKNLNLYRLRLGDFRVIFTKENNKLIIIILKIGNRGDIYK